MMAAASVGNNTIALAEADSRSRFCCRPTNTGLGIGRDGVSRLILLITLESQSFDGKAPRLAGVRLASLQPAT